MSQVIIGMDPHKRSATIEVMTSDETVVGGGRYGTDVSGYRAMPGALVPVDDRQRMAAPVTGYGVPAVMGEGGRPDRGRSSRSDPGQPSGSNLADYLK
jgi:hypothetical protein